MTTANAQDSAEGAPNGAILAHCADEIHTARGMKTTLPTYERAQRPSVNVSRGDQELRGQKHNPRSDRAKHIQQRGHTLVVSGDQIRQLLVDLFANHIVLCGFFRRKSSVADNASHDRLPIFLATFSASRHSDCVTRSNSAFPVSRGTTTRSRPQGSLGRLIRNASRSTLFQRFRTTALPSRLETDKPKRGWGKPFSWPNTRSSPSEAVHRLRYARRKSA